MANLLKLIKVFGTTNIAKLLPLIAIFDDLMNFIKDAQATFSGTGSNEQKLQHVVDQFVPIVKEAESDGLIGAQLADAITGGAAAIVSAAVQVMKLIGILHSATQPQPVPTPVPVPPTPPAQTSFASIDEAQPAARALGQFGAVALNAADNRYYAVDGRSALPAGYTIVWTQ